MKLIEQDSLWVVAFGLALVGTAAVNDTKSAEDIVYKAKRIANKVMEDHDIVIKIQRLLESQ